MADSAYLELEGGIIHYLIHGAGEKVLIAFHGYGLTSNSFNSFFEILGNDYTILSIDLPFHGKSIWLSENFYLNNTNDMIENRIWRTQQSRFSKSDLAQLIAHLQLQFNFENFSLLGFSLGGRICLVLIELFPKNIQKAVLIASDGYVYNPYYFFATHTDMGKYLLNKVVDNPNGFFKVVDLLFKLKIIDISKQKFIYKYLINVEDRVFLRKVWLSLATIWPDYIKLKWAIQNRNIPIYLVMGRYDRIIPLKNAVKFAKKIASCNIVVLQKGHKLLDKESVYEIAQLLL